MTIKTCPFCKLKMKKNDTCSGIWYSHVAHTGCFMCNFIVNEDDVEAWNKRASPWIPVSERLPTDHHPAYLVLEPDGSWHKAYIEGWGSDGDFEPSHWIHSEGNRCELNEFTHWQPVEVPE